MFILRRIPFDWRNPLGFSIVIIIQYEMASKILRLTACALSFALGTFIFAVSLVNDIKNDLHAINEMTKQKKTQSNISKQLFKFMDIHSDVKQLS